MKLEFELLLNQVLMHLFLDWIMVSFFQQKLMETQNTVILILGRVLLAVLKKHVEILFVLAQIQSEWLIIFNLVILRIRKYFGLLWKHLKACLILQNF